MLYRVKMNAPAACKHNHCHPVNGILVSWGRRSQINAVHSINLMDQMSQGLWMRAVPSFFFFFFALSDYVCVLALCVYGPGEETVGEACPL